MTYQSADCRDFVPEERVTFLRPASIWSLASRLVSSAKKRWAKHMKRRTDRAAFRYMLTLDDEILDDIGVTRANVEWASQLPLEMSASAELEKTARRARPKIRP